MREPLQRRRLKQYMQAQLNRAGTPEPKVIGIDEISIRKGHTYRIVVSDLMRLRPIWFGGQDRSEESLHDDRFGGGRREPATKSFRPCNPNITDRYS